MVLDSFQVGTITLTRGSSLGEIIQIARGVVEDLL